VALTETRKENAGSLREDDYTFFWKGVTIDKDNAQSRNAGVAFAIKNFLLEFIPHSPKV